MVFIARSLDGYIADKNGGLSWLESVPNPEGLDMGYSKFMEKIDAIIMGRNTFEVVCGFDIRWPYSRPVFVLSNTLKSLPEEYHDKVEILKGSVSEILAQVHQSGYTRLYIDGGATIQSFLEADRIDEITISTIPVLLGGGIPLFRGLSQSLVFEHLGSQVYLNAIVQDSYRRVR